MTAAEGPRRTERRDPPVRPPSWVCYSYLLFNVEGMEVVIVGEFGPSGHVPQSIQSDPVHAVNRPADGGAGGDSALRPAPGPPASDPGSSLPAKLSTFRLPSIPPNVLNAISFLEHVPYAVH